MISLVEVEVKMSTHEQPGPSGVSELDIQHLLIEERERHANLVSISDEEDQLCCDAIEQRNALTFVNLVSMRYDEDQLCCAHIEEAERQVGGRLFEFDLRPGQHRCVRRFGLHRRLLRQRTDIPIPPEMNVDAGVEKALERVIDQEIRVVGPELDDFLFFTVQHPTFDHAFQSVQVLVHEW